MARRGSAGGGWRGRIHVSLRASIHSVPDEALGNSSYVLEIGAGQAIVIDPRRDIEPYLDLATQRSLRIVGVLETHLHADFVSGARELAATTDVALQVAEAANVSWAHVGRFPADRFDLGDVQVEVIGTPGHTPEHLAYLVTRGNESAVFSGGSLIAGGAARTDLIGPERTEELSRAQFQSIHLIAGLDDSTLLLPTHGGGSFCSTTSGSAGPRTIGEERSANALLGILEEDDFVREFTATFGSYPPYFRHLRALNQRGASLVRDLDLPARLAGHDAKNAIDQGAWLIDARSSDAWSTSHAVESVSIELRPSFASWLGWVVPLGEPILLIVNPSDLEEALRLSRRIGYDRVVGWTTMQDWRDAGLATETGDVISAGEASVLADPVFVDVRQVSEFAVSHVSGAQHLELGDVITGRSPIGENVVVYCGHGERSATAASLLARRGIHVTNLVGGMQAWKKQGLPVS